MDGDCFNAGNVGGVVHMDLLVDVSIPSGPKGTYTMDVRLSSMVKVSTSYSGYDGAFQFNNVAVTPGGTLTATVNVYINGKSYAGTGTYTVPDWCECDATPNVLAAQDICKSGCTEPACAGVPNTFDLTPYSDAEFLGWGHMRVWRVIETAYHITYASGGVNDLGTLLELPASLSGNECYPGHMQLQIGCLRNGTYEWP